MSMKNANDTVGNRTHDLPACSAVPFRVPLSKLVGNSITSVSGYFNIANAMQGDRILAVATHTLSKIMA